MYFDSHFIYLLYIYTYLVGKNNGTVAGITYFTTDAQRGIFVRPDDFTIVSVPSIA